MMAQKQKHSKYGRVFEVSMLLLLTFKCHCCGATQPGHVDLSFPSNDAIPLPIVIS